MGDKWGSLSRRSPERVYGLRDLAIFITREVGLPLGELVHERMGLCSLSSMETSGPMPAAKAIPAISGKQQEDEDYDE